MAKETVKHGDSHPAGLSPHFHLSLHFDDTSCLVGKAHVTENKRQPSANFQQRAEASSPPALQEMNPSRNHAGELRTGFFPSEAFR